MEKITLYTGLALVITFLAASIWSFHRAKKAGKENAAWIRDISWMLACTAGMLSGILMAMTATDAPDILTGTAILIVSAGAQLAFSLIEKRKRNGKDGN